MLLQSSHRLTNAPPVSIPDPHFRAFLVAQCPVMRTLSVIGGKWKPAILWAMGQGPVRFGQLMRQTPGITQKMLTQQLRELEDDGIIWRKVYAEVPPRVEYGFTDHGTSLRPLLATMAQWGQGHQQHLRQMQG